MESIYEVNPQLDIPLYQQLVDKIRSAVKRGVLTPWQKLPTVQELSAELGIARGTIKRAYDELERLGFLEKVQGRGTFVCERPAETGNRKDRAMAVIDTMLDALHEIGLSASEINIFLNLKLREHAEQESQVKIALVECNPENLYQIAEQLRGIPRVDLQSYLLESVERYPYNLGEDTDLVITTATHAVFLESILPAHKRVIRVGLRLSPICLAEIFKLRGGETMGILCHSLRFGQLLYDTCCVYAEEVNVCKPVSFGQMTQDVSSFLADKDVVLVPKNFEKYCTDRVAQSLYRFKGTIIPCVYELDEGSYLYLQEKVKRLLEAKTI